MAVERRYRDEEPCRGIYTKENREQFNYQNKFIRVEPTEGDFGDYVPFIAVVVSSVSLGVSIAFWLFKIL